MATPPPEASPELTAVEKKQRVKPDTTSGHPAVGADRPATQDGSTETVIDVLLADFKDWRPITIKPQEPQVDGMIDDTTRIRRHLVRHLLDVQLSERLMMVSGLGTSMCIMDDKGARLAPSMWTLWNEVSKVAGASFPGILKAVGNPDGSTDIEALLSRCHGFKHLKPDPALDEFIGKAEKQIAFLCRGITDGQRALPVHESFLRRMTSRPTRLPRFQLFTTNYDLVWERAASNVKAVVIDGFTHADPQEFDPECFDYDVVHRGKTDAPEYIPKVFHLAKVHGSLDWKFDNGRIVKGSNDQPVMIYPRDNKYQLSYHQPFLELMARFQQSLRTPNIGVIVAGFGFNDEHLAHPIVSAIRSNPSLRVVVVDPGLKTPDEKRAGGKHFKFLADLIRSGDGRIALINASFEQYVRIMPELSVVPEAEAHRQRVGNAERR